MKCSGTKKHHNFYEWAEDGSASWRNSLPKLQWRTRLHLEFSYLMRSEDSLLFDLSAAGDIKIAW